MVTAPRPSTLLDSQRRAQARRAAYLAALGMFRRLPVQLRRTIVHTVTPDFTVGAVVAIYQGDKVLFLSQPHRLGWTLPGGLLNTGESAAEAVTREVFEEVGLDIEVTQPFTVNVTSKARRVDVIYVVDAGSDIVVRPAGEARGFRWIDPADVREADSATREILQALRHAQRVPLRGRVAGP